MAEIVPALLVPTFREIHDGLDMVASRVSRVQIDICDGQYVPSKTWPYTSNKRDINFDALVAQETGLPHWEEIDFEFDLMVSNPMRTIPDFIAIGASRIVVHRGSVSNSELDQILAEYGSGSETLSDFGIEIGIAYPPDKTIVDDIARIRDRIDFVQIMGIEKVGFQGQPFSPHTIETVRAVRERFKDLEISVDGGVTLDTAPSIALAGADFLVVGSAIFGEHDRGDALNAFLEIQ